MLVPRYEIRLRVAEQQALEALQRAGKTPQQTVRRVSILLLAQAGLSNQAIADQVGTSRNLVQKWRKRFALYEPPPLLAEEEVDPSARLTALQDLSRSGRPPDFSPSGPPHGRRRRVPRRGGAGV
jgi:transposase-like protein